MGQLILKGKINLYENEKLSSENRKKFQSSDTS